MEERFSALDSSRMCPVCGEEFYAGDEWVYRHWDTNRKKNRIYFCSWGCMRRYENGETELTGRGMALSTKKRRVFKALDDGLSVKEIAILLDISPHQVSYYKSKWVPKARDDDG